ncbi:MAG: thiamine phosphate synthase [Magnetococcales bacterium]|nr:thiamine phosphate synthase [Magnetococcales bacterium]
MPIHTAMQGVLPILDADCLEQINLINTADIRAWHDQRPTPLPAIATFLGHSGVSWLQLRCKRPAAQCTDFFAAWMEALRRYSPHLKVIINDHLALALQLCADGIHVGQEDTAVAQCRRQLPADKWIGLSTHSAAEVQAANGQPIDYIGFGPVYPTQTKADAQAVQGVARLAEMCRLSQHPVVAIGGIHIDHLPAIAACGASGAAMISGVWQPEKWQQRLQQAVGQWPR